MKIALACDHGGYHLKEHIKTTEETYRKAAGHPISNGQIYRIVKRHE